MKLLAIDTTGLPVSAAICLDGLVIGELYLQIEKKHAPTLLPLIDSLLKITETELCEIDGIAVCCGPGSFTGIRIGAACAQGFSYALGKPIYAVNTLDALLINVSDANNRCAVMDARRGEVYAKAETDNNSTIFAGVTPLSDLLDRLGERHPFAFCGDGALKYREQILSALPKSTFAAQQLILQRASGAAACAFAGKAEKSAYDGLRLNYIRDPGAKRQKEAKILEDKI